MLKIIKWLIVLGIVAFLIEYWYIILPIFAILIFFSHKSKNSELHETIREEICEQSFSFRDYDTMSGHEFEQYCADVLRRNGFKNVYVTKGSGDFGIDILATKKDKKYAIQCKNYSSKVGNHAIQEAYSGKDYYYADIAVVITNNFFTQAAIELADNLDVELWNRDILNNMISNCFEPETVKVISSNPEAKSLDKDNPHLKFIKNISYLMNTKDIIDIPESTTTITEGTQMYDEHKGIYPSGEYLIGEDIPIGKYILTQRSADQKGEIHIYKDYLSYMKDEDSEIIYKSFIGDYHLSLRTEGNFIVIENADIQKI